MSDNQIEPFDDGKWISGHRKEGNPTYTHSYIIPTYIYTYIYTYTHTYIDTHTVFFVTVPDGKAYQHLH
jgi:hypothetical protein